MSISRPSYQPYMSLRILESNYMRINDILHELKRKNKKWNISKLVNLALFDFLKRLPNMKDTELEKLFKLYEDAWEEQKGAN